MVKQINMKTKTRQNLAETFRNDLNDFAKLWNGSNTSMAKHFGKTPQVLLGLLSGKNSPTAKTMDKMIKIINNYKQ